MGTLGNIQTKQYWNVSERATLLTARNLIREGKLIHSASCGKSELLSSLLQTALSSEALASCRSSPAFNSPKNADLLTCSFLRHQLHIHPLRLFSPVRNLICFFRFCCSAAFTMAGRLFLASLTTLLALAPIAAGTQVASTSIKKVYPTTAVAPTTNGSVVNDSTGVSEDGYGVSRSPLDDPDPVCHMQCHPVKHDIMVDAANWFCDQYDQSVIETSADNRFGR